MKDMCGNWTQSVGKADSPQQNRGKNAKNGRWHGFCYMFSVMKNETLHKGECGSMMMEYVIATAAIGMALIIYMNRSFFDFADGFGEMGQQIVAIFERTAGGLALPIP